MNRPAALAILSFAAVAAAPSACRAQSKNPSFNLVNRTEAPMREFFATPAGRENWGQSRLSGRTLAPGGRVDIRLPADGNCIYDMRAVFADGRAEDRKHVDTCKLDDVVFAPGDQRPGRPAGAATTAATHDPSFRLVNRGASPIAEVFASLPQAARGDNLLADGATLAPQGARVFTLPPGAGCTYDLRVVFADKQSREKKAADLCRMGDLPVQ